MASVNSTSDGEHGAVHILIGTPVAGGLVSHEYVYTVLGLQAAFLARGWALTLETRPDGLVTRSRNHFGSRVAASTRFTHLLMIDADVALRPEVAIRLVESGHDVCAAVVALRQVDWGRVRTLLDTLPDATEEQLAALSHMHAVEFETANSWQHPVQGFLPVRSVGSAAMLIRREALLRLVDSEHVTPFDAVVSGSSTHETGWTFFDPYVDERGIYLSEDYAFCHRWRQAGGQVWADIRSRTQHVGPVAITGDIATSLAVSSQLAASTSPRPDDTSDRSQDT